MTGNSTRVPIAWSVPRDVPDAMMQILLGVYGTGTALKTESIRRSTSTPSAIAS